MNDDRIVMSAHLQAEPYILFFEDAAEETVTRIGGKCIGLAALAKAKAPISPGFIVTTDAFAEMMAQDRLGAEIADLLNRLDVNNIRQEAGISHFIEDAIMRRPLPAAIDAAIRRAYGSLETDLEGEATVAVRSSGTAEDLPDASFAGQGDTFLGVVGAEHVLEMVKRCWASLYSARAISYRAQCHIGHRDVQMAVAVQVMVDARSAGVAITLDPVTGDRSKIIIESSWGLGEPLVSGEITPGHFMVDKVMLLPVASRIATKSHELVLDPATRKAVLRPVPLDRTNAPSISDAELKALAQAAKTIERRFGCPQDIEWAIDARRTESGGVVILQSRPETVWSRKHAPIAPQGPASRGVAGVLDALIAPLARSG